MREFFRGWRKKTGCVTLMMALAVVGAWGRSLYKFDVLNSPLGQENAMAITSWKEMFVIRIGWDRHDSWREFVWRTVEGDQFEYTTDSISEFYRFKQPIPDGSGCSARWWVQGDWGGVGDTPVDERSWRRMIFIIAHYWLIAVPLTAISAFLLFSPPRKSSPKRLINPIPAEVA